MRPGFLGNTDDLPLARAAKQAKISAMRSNWVEKGGKEVPPPPPTPPREDMKTVSLRTRSAKELNALRKRDAAIKSAQSNMSRTFATPKAKSIPHPSVGRPAMAKGRTPTIDLGQPKPKPKSKAKGKPKAPAGKPLPASASPKAQENYAKTLEKLAKKRAEKAAKREKQLAKWAGRPQVLKRWAARDAANQKRLAHVAIRQAKEDAKDEKRREEIMGRPVGTPEGKANREKQLKQYEEHLAQRRLKRAREKARYEEAQARAIAKREKWQRTKDKVFNTLGQFLGWQKRETPGLDGWFGYYGDGDYSQRGQGNALVPLDPSDNPFLGSFGSYETLGSSRQRLGSYEYNDYSGYGYQDYQGYHGFQNEFEKEDK
jgi:hypothetical protein